MKTSDYIDPYATHMGEKSVERELVLVPSTNYLGSRELQMCISRSQSMRIAFILGGRKRSQRAADSRTL